MLIEGDSSTMMVHRAEFVTSAPALKACPPATWPEIAFAGRSNVGKSSLINCLLGRKNLVRTSSTPGRTQMLNFFAINDSFYFVDLPGYGFARAPKSVRRQWQPMVHEYLQGRSSLKALVWLLDVRRDPGQDDLQFLDWLEQNDIPTIPVVTKVDKVSRSQRRQRMAKISDLTGLSAELLNPFSILSGEGFEPLWDMIEDVLSD